MKFILTYTTAFGSVSAESEDPEELPLAYAELENLAARLSKKMRESGSNTLLNRRVAKKFTLKVPETSAVLRELESSVLSSDFFEEPKTTGDTCEKLHTLTGKYFASRKVSQALGILKDRGKLKRKGKRNFYAYSLS